MHEFESEEKNEQALKEYEQEIKKLFLEDFRSLDELVGILMMAGARYVEGVPHKKTTGFGKDEFGDHLPMIDELLIIKNGNTLDEYLTKLTAFMKEVLDAYLNPRLRTVMNVCRNEQEPFFVSPLLLKHQKQFSLLKVKTMLAEDLSHIALQSLISLWEGDVDSELAANN